MQKENVSTGSTSFKRTVKNVIHQFYRIIYSNVCYYRCLTVYNSLFIGVLSPISYRTGTRNSVIVFLKVIVKTFIYKNIFNETPKRNSIPYYFTQMYYMHTQ